MSSTPGTAASGHRRFTRLSLDAYALLLAGVVVALALIGALPKVGW